MKIALVGITEKIGSQIALEAKKRGHAVTGISRRAASTSSELASFPVVAADIFDHLGVSPGVQLVDTPGFPDMYKPYALAHRDALAVLREAKDKD